MSWSACSKIAAVVVFAEFLLTAFFELTVVEPGMQGLGFMCLAAVAPITVLSIFFAAAVTAPRGSGGKRSQGGDVIQPWMRSNMYFNNQEMQHDIDRLTQLAEERAIRDREVN